MSIIFKPGTTKGPVILLSEQPSSPPSITLANGQTVTAERGDQHGGSFFNEGNYQYVFPAGIIQSGPAILTVNGQSQKIANTTSSFRGNGIGSLSESSKGAVGPGATGVGGAGQPGNIGNPTQTGAGFVGAYQQTPNFQSVQFQPIKTEQAKLSTVKTPDYNFTDPASYQQNYGNSVRGEFAKDFALSDNFALSTLNTELTGLKSFAPAAAALKRSETSVDNQFNQGQRTSQVQNTLGDVQQGLKNQTADAQTYSQGKLTNSIDDTALQYGLGSQSADTTSQRGFGDNSLVGANDSRLMSARERFQIAQYGNQLKTQNSADRQQLELAPTEYSDAGTQIKVNPSKSAGELTQDYAKNLGDKSIISASDALTNTTNQQQFATNTQYNTSTFNATQANQTSQFNTTQKNLTNQFNATNSLQSGQYNSSNTYASQLNTQMYNSSQAQKVADLGTAQMNQQREDKQVADLTASYQKNFDKAQASGNTAAVLSTFGSVLALVTGGGTSGASPGALSGLATLLTKGISSLSGLFGGGGDASTAGAPSPVSTPGPSSSGELSSLLNLFTGGGGSEVVGASSPVSAAPSGAANSSFYDDAVNFIENLF